METCDVAIIGGGPAGLAAAISAKKTGAGKVVIFERDAKLGGILNQCIHNGFGLHTFKEELTGPEYAQRYIDEAKKYDIEYKLGTTVLSIAHDKTISATSRKDGIFCVKPSAIVLAMGCSERPLGALGIPGFRPAGIYTAGNAQKMVNLRGLLPGREIVILGSGDIGLIMARRMTFEGAHVKVVAEIMPYSGGLQRNIVQCLDDFGIPLKLSHTVTDIKGKERVEGVTIARVGQDGKAIAGTEEYYSCDTLLLSCGLLPDNGLSRKMGVSINPATRGAFVNESFETNVPGVFACGNVLHVHDLVDFVSQESAMAGENAANYALGNYARNKEHHVEITAGKGVRYTVPSTINAAQLKKDAVIRFRVDNIYKNSAVAVYLDGEKLQVRKKNIFAPGEMEQIILTKEQLNKFANATSCELKIEAVQ